MYFKKKKQTHITQQQKKRNLILKMGRSKQHFFQRIHTDGQQGHEKIFNITSQQKNAN